MVSQRREAADARAVFGDSKKKTNHTKAIIHDGLKSYDEAFQKEFFTLKYPRGLARISMKEAAELGWLCIRYIEYYGLHSSVGVRKFPPQIHFIPDDERNESGEKIDYEVNSQTRPDLFARIKRNTSKKFNKHRWGIGRLVNNP
jgi:hypothetical protein